MKIILSNLMIRHWTCLLCYKIWRYATGQVDYVIQFDETPMDILITPSDLVIRHWTWLCYPIWQFANRHVDYVIQFDVTPLDLLIMLYNLTIRHWTSWLCYTICETPTDILIMLSNLVVSHWTWLWYPIWRYATGLLQPVQVSFNGWNSLAVNDYCYLTGTVCRWCCLIYQSYVALSVTLVLAIRWGSETYES